MLLYPPGDVHAMQGREDGGRTGADNCSVPLVRIVRDFGAYNRWMGHYILLVEDDEHDLSFTRRVLELCSIGDPVRIAHDGAEALEILESPDEDMPLLILLDLKLPKVDGFDVLKRVRSTPRLEDVPVIIVSGSLLEADRVRAMFLGANNYVVKMLGFDEFAQLLALALTPYAGRLNADRQAVCPSRRTGDQQPS